MNAVKKPEAITLRPEWFGAAAFGGIELPVTTFERIEAPEQDVNIARVKRAVIVDYGVGNLRSISNALGRLGVDTMITANPKALYAADALILPGVGAFGRAMDNLRAAGLVEVLSEAVCKRRLPTLGICLGMQIMAESSNELGEHCGLGWIEGKVRRLSGKLGLPVPHVGWNQIAARPKSLLLDGIPPGASFYFDHSFALLDSPTVSGTCDYDGKFVATVEQDNLMAVQCHPEKSQSAGMRLLANFLAFAARRRAG